MLKQFNILVYNVVESTQGQSCPFAEHDAWLRVRNGEIHFHESTMELEISAHLHALATLCPKSTKHVINETGFWMVSKFTLGEAKIHHTYHTQNSGYVFNLYIIIVPVLS
jgi:hypothetical protein